MSKELLRQALDDIQTGLRIEGLDLEIGSRKLLKETITTIRATLAQPVQPICGSQNPESEPQTGLSLIDATQAVQPVGYVNGDELDNMLDDRTAILQTKMSGHRKTPLYRAISQPVQPEPTTGNWIAPENGEKALYLACYFQNQVCDLEEIIELFCLDAEAAQPLQPCMGCNGHGEVGGLRSDGYYSEICPYCKGGGTEQIAQPAPVAQAEPIYHGYAKLGTGQYVINHTGDLPAELIISLATEEEKEGRVVGDDRANAPGKMLQVESMCIRIEFSNVAGLDALEKQLVYLRKQCFPDTSAQVIAQSVPVAQAEPLSDAAYKEAASLAMWIFKRHYAKDPDYATGRVTFSLCDSTAGVISQIENMVAGLDRVQPSSHR